MKRGLFSKATVICLFVLASEPAFPLSDRSIINAEDLEDIESVAEENSAFIENYADNAIASMKGHYRYETRVVISDADIAKERSALKTTNPYFMVIQESNTYSASVIIVVTRESAIRYIFTMTKIDVVGERWSDPAVQQKMNQLAVNQESLTIFNQVKNKLENEFGEITPEMLGHIQILKLGIEEQIAGDFYGASEVTYIADVKWENGIQVIIDTDAIYVDFGPYVEVRDKNDHVIETNYKSMRDVDYARVEKAADEKLGASPQWTRGYSLNGKDPYIDTIYDNMPLTVMYSDKYNDYFLFRGQYAIKLNLGSR
jgi:hypothetical protein